MLKRRYRLTKRDNVTSILRSGSKAMSNLLVARFRPNELDHHRFSAIVSNKISHKATERNRVRRQIYELVRLNLEKFPEKPRFDILILPKKSIIGAPYTKLENNFLSLIPNIHE